MCERIVPMFPSKEVVNAYLTGENQRVEMAVQDWQRAFKEPIGQLNSALEEVLTDLGVDLDSCWEEITMVEDGKVRKIGINRPFEGKTQEIVVSESRAKGETARLEIRIGYPDRSVSPPTYEYEVYTLALNCDIPQIVVVSGEAGESEPVTIRVSQMPLLDLQISEAPCKRLGLEPIFKFNFSRLSDLEFKNPLEAKKIFSYGVEQVCQALKAPNFEITP